MSACRADLLGQLLVIGLQADRWNSSVERVLRAVSPGGVIFCAHNLHTPGSTAELLSRIGRALMIIPLLVIEEEGGTVDPLRASFPSLPSPRAAAEKSSAAVARLGELVGQACRLFGFNTNFAPVLDLASSGSGSNPGTRSFSADPHQVARYGKAFVRGLRRHKILTCGKHFPGLNSAESIGRSSLPIIAKPMAAMWLEDLVPYRELRKELPMVMVSRAAYKAYDFDVPRRAILSANVVEGLLRVKLGYRGVAVADVLEAATEQQELDVGDVATQSLNAGCDLLLVRSEISVGAILAGLKRGIESGKLAVRRVREALERIRAAKKSLTRPRGKRSRTVFDQLTRKFESFAKEFQPREQKIA